MNENPLHALAGLPPAAVVGRRYLFFTGKGGVGKTTMACAVALGLADAGRRVLLVSTDPASNLGDLLGVVAREAPQPVPGVANLHVADLDPEQAAAAYRRRVIEPRRGLVPDDELRALEEQLSGQCTVEIAAFDEFTRLIVDPPAPGFDSVVFDTAPTGHTLRLLNLPEAWSTYLEQTPAGASCLGPLSGLDAQREQYQETVRALADGAQTLVVLVSRPEAGALREAGRAARELEALGMANLRLLINGVLEEPLDEDGVAQALAARQRGALAAMPKALRGLPRDGVPLRGGELVGVEALRALLEDGPATAEPVPDAPTGTPPDMPGVEGVESLIDELAAARRGAVLVMGKGGVGKSSIAAMVALGLSKRGHRVELTTTDPAGRWEDVLGQDPPEGLTLSAIDPQREVAAYIAERLEAARGLDADRRALLEEDLRSPCTEELAVFRAFSRTLTRARHGFVVLDTAPTGHTLLLLDTTGAYHRDTMRRSGRTGVRMTTPLMRLQDGSFTHVLIVTLPESTPVQEAERLQDDLRRAEIEPFGWVVNASVLAAGTRDPVLAARARLEQRHINRVRRVSARTWVVPWTAQVTGLM